MPQEVRAELHILGKPSKGDHFLEKSHTRKNQQEGSLLQKKILGKDPIQKKRKDQDQVLPLRFNGNEARNSTREVP